MVSLVNFMKQRPILDFTSLDLSQVKLELEPMLKKPELDKFLDLLSKMQL